MTPRAERPNVVLNVTSGGVGGGGGVRGRAVGRGGEGHAQHTSLRNQGDGASIYDASSKI